MPEIIDEAHCFINYFRYCMMAAKAVEDCEREKAKTVKVEELMEKVKGERDVLTKEKDGLSRCVFDKYCKIKELEVLNVYQQDAVEDLKSKIAEQNEQHA